ncbi:Uncharacterised protein [Nocardiopsis dassonvillei]|uniref:Iron-containing alcohol dehydrogenase n=1 Tax=Nocardiopsis dassonvillei (strain ATCC 23218 / DSM 43111 / CIP 107115 / JCM 7437 / KCTC 9190 / NBRC 14626 / NCTC 10488 / NRRL B-5397 / IMRU 509) TaxID=446468 RepID=D7AWI1_NOCDD|nr:iron-containing alcohol dehydrogenase [Nocardiopsis dassonvillei subsp. dassonvillei DSM 43111]VEI91968.1 Uncharacterised protein [Nocardiopsis dassonvillei]
MLQALILSYESGPGEPGVPKYFPSPAQDCPKRCRTCLRPAT